jgi:hypothetical protein
VIPGVGHSTVSDPRDCAAEQILRFVRGAKLATSCRRVPTGVPAYDSAPASFDALESVPGYSRKVGRTLRSISATAQDLVLILATATTTGGGGLRGGSWGRPRTGRSSSTAAGSPAGSAGARSRRISVR